MGDFDDVHVAGVGRAGFEPRKSWFRIYLLNLHTSSIWQQQRKVS